MSGWQAVPSAPSPAGGLAGDGWWPDLDLDALKAAVRIDPAVTPERLRQAAIAAVLSVTRDAEAWRADQALAGRANLAAVPARQIGGLSAKLQAYRQAVYSLAAAELNERGVNVQPIFHPAVPERLARLRFFISAAHTPEQLAAAARTTAEVLDGIVVDQALARAVSGPEAA